MEEKKVVKYVIKFEKPDDEEILENFLQENPHNVEVRKLQFMKNIMDILKLTKNDKH